MIQVPTPQQHALVAQMLQGALGTQQPNPYVLQQGGQYYDTTPNIGAPDDWGFNAMRTLPTVVRQGYGHLASPTIMEDAPQQIQAARPPRIGIPDRPASVFGKMRQSLPAATRSALQSHQQALIERFMRNATAKGVGK
jgi:hypothetical protein